MRGREKRLDDVSSEEKETDRANGGASPTLRSGREKRLGGVSGHDFRGFLRWGKPHPTIIIVCEVIDVG